MQNLLSKIDVLNSDIENYYSELLPFLSEANLFQPLVGGSFQDFHEKLIRLSSHKHGVGLSVGVMAQINIAGELLKLSAQNGDHNSKEILEQITNGKHVVSMGVSEPGWKGRLSNIKSCIKLQGNNYKLNVEKSFLTNGMHAHTFLVVVKTDEKNDYKIVLLPRNTEGLNITKFTLPFAKEATHCKIKCEDLEIDAKNILDVSYKDNAENLRLSEMLSMAAVFIGFGCYLLERIKENKELLEDLKSDKDKQKRLLDCKILLDVYKSRVLELSKMKDDDPKLELRKYFPYGTETISELFYNNLITIFSIDLVKSLSEDIGLFLMRDPLNEFYIKQAAKKLIGFQVD